MKKVFNSNARWIWHGATSCAGNKVICFRRSFEVEGESGGGELRITADSRYEVFVNGTWLGHGPARSWPSPWPVDAYDLRGLLRPGRNVIAVLVQHWGIGTFQYLPAEPGLIAEAAWRDTSGAHLLFTDAAWRGRTHDGFLWPVPRIDCQMAWEEQFDARLAPGDWMSEEFDDAAWPSATVTHAQGEGTHARFVPRDIPMLTREPTAPVRVLSVEAVRRASYTWTLNPREFLNPQDRTANFLRGRMLLLTHIYSERAQRADFHPPHHRPAVAWKLNRRLLTFDDYSLQKTDTGVAHAPLKAGWNTLMALLPEEEHHWWAVLNIWTERPVQFAARPKRPVSDQPWLAMGPFSFSDLTTLPTNGVTNGISQTFIEASAIAAEATDAQFQKIWGRGALGAAEYDAAYVQPLARDMIAAADVYAQCAAERVVEGLLPRVKELTALLRDTPEWTTIDPVKNADVRVLLDFGREVVGFHEFEIDAPEGTIVDDHNFEFIQPDGRFNLGEGMNNSFRYICREGVQRYRTLLRRGFRYSWLSFRDFRRPLRIRFVRVLMSTYPQAGQGAFACSDPQLDRIWEAGVHSVRCCSEDTYTDCPTYEQTFWVGDARNEALVDLVANGDPRLSAHCWEIAAQSLERSPLVESQVPSAWENMLPAWSFLWMRWAQEHFHFTGDTKLARRMIPWLARNVAGIERFLSERGLIRIAAWNMFDWAPMDTPSGGEVTHLNCLAVLGLHQAADLARRIGAAREAKRWDELAGRLRRSINRHLWDARQNAYIDCIRPDGIRSTVFSQQTQTAAYIAGIPAGARLQRCREMMTRAPHGFVPAGSPFFMFFVLEGLAREKQFGPMVKTIGDYWGRQIQAGATTFWEIYHAGEARMTRSHCHGWSAAPTFFLSHYILGVQPLDPGYATVRLAPQLAGLTWTRGRVPTPKGPVECSWKYDGRRFELGANVPSGVPVVIDLPVAGRIQMLAGKLKSKTVSDGLASLRVTGTRIHLHVETARRKRD